MTFILKFDLDQIRFISQFHSNIRTCIYARNSVRIPFEHCARRERICELVFVNIENVNLFGELRPAKFLFD